MINRTAGQVGFLVSGAHVEVVDCTVEDCPRYAQAELDAAVAAERERCAKIEAAAEALIDAYRSKYKNEARGDIRANAPLRAEVAELNYALRA